MNILFIGPPLTKEFTKEYIKRGHTGLSVISQNFYCIIKDNQTKVFAGKTEIKKGDYDAFLIMEAKLEYLNCIYPAVKALIDMGIPPIRSIESAMICKNKFECGRIAVKNNIKVPNQLLFSSVQTLATKSHEIGYPMIYKELDRSVGNGIIYVDTPYTLFPLAEMCIGKDMGFKSYLIQEFINSNCSDERYIVCNGKIVCAMKRKATDGNFRANLGKEGTAEPITQIDEETAQMAIKIVNSIEGLYFAGVDIIRKDNIPYFIELNYQPGLQIINVTGHNYMIDFIDFIEKRVEEIKKAIA